MRFILVFVLIMLTFNTESALAQCTNPNGTAGELMYNQNHDVFQGCTTRGWMAFHQPDAAGTAFSGKIGDDFTAGTILTSQSGPTLVSKPPEIIRFSFTAAYPVVIDNLQAYDNNAGAEFDADIIAQSCSGSAAPYTCVLDIETQEKGVMCDTGVGVLECQTIVGSAIAFTFNGRYLQ